MNQCIPRKETADGTRRAVQSVTSDENPVILVLDDSEQTCRALWRDIRALGRRAIYTVSTNEAVTWLTDPEIFIDTLVVDLFLGSNDGLEVLAFTAREFPLVRRVLISGQVLVTQLQLACLCGRAHAVIQKPWNRHKLAQALRLPPLA